MATLTGTLRPVDYRWALDATGRPVPIEQARRGQLYTCPLCRGPMIVRKGDQLQHHYAHEYLTACTSEAVNRAALRRWIAIQLTEALAADRAIAVQWLCRRCGSQHSQNLLEGVAHVAEDYLQDAHYVDVLIAAADNTPRGAVFVQDAAHPMMETLHFFVAQNIFVITVPLSVTPGGPDIGGLIAKAAVVGGPCPVWQRATNVLAEGEAIRQKLVRAVSGPPGYLYAPVQTINGLSDCVQVGNEVLWLPLEQWKAIIGGTRNPLAPRVQVLIQTWTQPDGGTIYLYYVTIKETRAIAVRRYGPGAEPVIQLDSRFRRYGITALDVARYLVTH